MRQILLDFYTAELSSHANTIIGLAIVLFSFLTMTPKSYSYSFVQQPLPYILIVIANWLFMFGMSYTFGRLQYYGAFAHQILVFNDQVTTVAAMK